MLFIPITAMFYRRNGLDDFDLFVLQGSYAIATSLLEIPSGYIADVWGRRNSLILGSILGVCGFIIYSVSFGFWGFLFAELVLGIGVSFMSGSDSAMLYDTLDSMKKPGEYLKYEGRITSLGNFFETGAALAGGLVAGIFSLRTPYILQVFVAFTAIPAAFLLVEPLRQSKHKIIKFKNIISITMDSLFKHKERSTVIFLSASVGAATLTMAWCVQLFGVHHEFNEFQITSLWVVLNLVVGFSALFAHKFDVLLPKKLSVILVMITIPLGYFSFYLLGVYSMIYLVVFYFVRGFATPTLKDMINKTTNSDIRATVMSIRNLVIRLIFMLIGLLIGGVSSRFGFGLAMIVGAIFFTLVIGLCVLYYQSVHSKTKLS